MSSDQDIYNQVKSEIRKSDGSSLSDVEFQQFLQNLPSLQDLAWCMINQEIDHLTDIAIRTNPRCEQYIRSVNHLIKERIYRTGYNFFNQILTSHNQDTGDYLSRIINLFGIFQFQYYGIQLQ
jgi:hypothetical protein